MTKAQNDIAQLWDPINDAYVDNDVSEQDILDMVLDAEEQLAWNDTDTPHRETEEIFHAWNEDERQTEGVKEINWIELRQKRARERASNIVPFPQSPDNDSEALEDSEDGEEASEETPTQINDAEILGRNCPEMQALLDSNATLLTGEVWGLKDRRNTQDGDWNQVELTWAQWIQGGDKPAWGFSRHPAGKHKEGACVVLGSSVDGARMARAMDEMYAMGLDIDSGADLDDVLALLEEKEIFSLVYTSFNHGKRRLEIKRDDVLKKLQISGDPTLPQIQQYLLEHSKSRYETDFVANVTIREQKKQTKKGVVIVLDTPPLHKFRILFPLAEPVKLIDLAASQEESLKIWEDKVTGLAQNTLGLHFDTSCTDPSRLFYTARHPKDAEDWYCAIIQGAPLNFDAVKPMRKAIYLKNRDIGDNPFELASGSEGTADARTPSGNSLKAWAAQGYADRFFLLDLLSDECPDRVRNEVSDTLWEVECPFDDGHNNAGDPDDRGCHVKSGDRFRWRCKHDSCQGYDRLDMLAKVLADGWFDEELLYDDTYLYPADDDDEDELIEDDDRFEPRRDWLPKGYKVRDDTIYLKGDDGASAVVQVFDVVGRASNLAGDGGAGRIISFINENGVEVELTLNLADLFKDNGVIDVLADAGMRMYVGGKGSKENLLNLFRWMTPQRQIPTVPRPGWVRDRGGLVQGFLCPTGEYIPAVEGMPYRLSSAATAKDRHPKGTLEGWRDAADAALKAKGNFYWATGVCAAFAGPLLSLVGLSACGFNLSGESSKGKTLSLMLGSSAWTTPREKRGVFFPMNTTTNAIEDLASIGSEAFLALDEIGSMSRPQDVASILFGLSTGAGKSRKAGRAAGLAEDAEFLPFVMLTNERSLRTVVKDAGGDYKTGLSVRFPDLDVTGGKQVGQEIIRELEKAKTNFGHAGPEFVRYLIAEGWHERGHELRQMIEKAAKKLAAKAKPAQARAANVFALVQVAGELACDAGILSDKSKVQAAVRRAWSAFKASDEGKATEGESALLDGFRSWLKRSMGRTVVAASEHEDPTYRDIRGWYTDTHFILDWSLLADMQAMGLSGTRSGLVSALKKADVLEMSGKNSSHNKLPAVVGGGKVTNVRIDREKLGLPNEPADEEEPAKQPSGVV